MRQITFIFFIGMITLISCKSKRANNQLQKPNIIYILADDLGYGDLGCYRQTKIQTPNLDKMAAEGIRFTNHYSGNTVCAPSRYNLLTGKHPGHSTIRGNGCQGGCPMLTEDKTVAEYLKEAGYTTGIIGKWGNGDAGTEGFPTKQGFDYFIGYANQILAHNYWPEFIWENNKKIYLNNSVNYFDSTEWHGGYGSYTLDKNEYAHHLFTNKALEFITRKKDTSFFLYLPYTIPHDNGEAPEGEKYEIPDHGIYRDSSWSNEAKSYAAMISLMDQDIGKILKLLKEINLHQNTLVIFDSDNGPPMDMNPTRFFDSNRELRGGKRDLYEGGIRTPFIAWWPENITPGRISNLITASWDFLPTACDLAGIDAENGLDGISFLPELLNKEQPKHEFLYWEFQGAQAVRMGKWKGVKFKRNNNDKVVDELYNLSIDENENNNVLNEHPDVAIKISEIMKTQHLPNEKFPLK